MSKLTEQQAYLAMFSFLEAEYRLSSSDEIGALLGCMSLLSDGAPADPAVKQQWSEAVTAALGDKVNATLTFTK